MADTQEDVVDLVSRLRGFDEDDFYSFPWTVNEACLEAAEELTSLRSQNKVMREALSTAAIRFDLLASDIAESHAVAGTLRAARTIRAKNFALEAMNALSPTSKDETPQ